MKTLLEWALIYAKCGWLVFPCHTALTTSECSCGSPDCTNIGKHPRTLQGWKNGSRDPNKLHEWFGPGAPPSNIAIVTGRQSGLTVLDIDVGEGKSGDQSWAIAIRDHGDPDTLMAKTGSGGFHICFQYSSEIKTGTNVLGKGIDCRNDGGYIVAPCSRHRSGKTYEWLNWDTSLAPFPNHLVPDHKERTRGRPRKDDLVPRHYTLRDVESMLAVIPSDGRDLWRNVGIILGRAFNRSDEAWDLYKTWADKWDGVKAKGHDKIMHEAFHEISQQAAERELSLGTLVKTAQTHGWIHKTGNVPVEDFVFHLPDGKFLYLPTLSSWPASSVDVAVSPIKIDNKAVKASEWLKVNRRATSLAHDPGLADQFIEGANCVNGEIVKNVGAATFNTYRRPTIELGDANRADPFVKHCQRLFNKPGDADQFLDYMAHRVQRPGEKPRFGLLIGGEQGIGKDTAIEMCIPAIGAWNVISIDPAVLATPYNEHAAASLVRISEAANAQEMSKWAFNESLKVLISGSPDFCVINPKYGIKYTVRLHCGVLLTTNHLLSGIYIPEDDRRYDVIECATKNEMGLGNPSSRRKYFTNLWTWYWKHNGAQHIAAFLHKRDLRKFDASLGQRITAAHQTVVRCGMEPDEWAADAVEQCKYKEMISGSAIYQIATKDRSGSADVKPKISHAMRRLGYVVYPNPSCKDGRWKINGKQHKIFRLLTHRPQKGWEKKLDLGGF